MTAKLRMTRDVLLLACVAVMCASAWLTACGGTTGATRTAYSVEVAHCIAAERAIIDRTGTTEAQDRADMAAERARCDARLSQISGGQ